MNLRRPKSITTDYRVPRAGGKPPLERDSKPRPGAAASPDVWAIREAKRAAESAEHDKWVSDLSPRACIGAALAINTRSVEGLPWMEKTWIQGRKAALRRRIAREGWTAATAAAL